jgi:hypothetical protein
MQLRLVTIAVLLVGSQCFAAYKPAAGETDGLHSQEVSWPTKSWPVSTPEEQGMDPASSPADRDRG